MEEDEPSAGQGVDDEGEIELVWVWRRRALWVLAGGVLLTLLVVSLGRTPMVRGWWRSELDWRGQRIYEPEHPVALDRVDLPQVHAQLLPRWLVAQGHRARGDGAEAEIEAWQALQAAVEPDANLAALLQELRELSSPARLRDDPRRALYLFWAWNDYLDHDHAPFMVQASVRAQGFGPSLAATIYHVHADAAVGVGSAEHRVRIVSRIDGTNLREAYLGAAGREDAVVVVDRLVEFALDDVWPLLDPWLELRSVTRASFAEPIRAEARARLSAAALRRLQGSAAARWSIASTVRAIEARRRECDSGLRINEVPWSGFSSERLARLTEIASRHQDRACPGITTDEVGALARATASLRPDPALRAALEELVALTAEHVAIHEARHLADDALAEGFDEPLPCASCSDGMGIGARSELSGYLASLAWAPSPALALYQACRSLAAEHGRPLPPGEPHREALELLQRRMGPVCHDGPPPDLRRLGRHLEQEMLGRSDPIALPPAFPRRLPVDGAT
ncbi:hypothetical protein [Paraliomyxa miuraensis]|uniref:hypothetical protein n=1 Tax=Paraliomyxa miuraensis TaxID=376150 RepID=UPI0022585498|nr:hypothetical protein [Paraliomyxa miuraensis]MCX4244069.1 hypothetical protein [Paraliomyxa miuraensis]